MGEEGGETGGVGGKEVRPAQRGKSAGQVKGNKNIKAEERGSEN